MGRKMQQQLEYAIKGRKFAWAKYYEMVNQAHRQDGGHYRKIQNLTNDAIPTHIKTMLTDMAQELKMKWECPVCLDFIADGSVAITNCGHIYCTPCLEQLKKITTGSKWKCAMCKRKLS